MHEMSLLTLIVAIAATGVILWAINKFLPMDARIKMILNVVVIIVLVVVVLNAFGIIDAIRGVKVPRAHG